MYIRKTMTIKVVTISKYADILEARALMVTNRFRHLPVVDENNTLAGIITDRDVRSALSLERYNAPTKYDPAGGISGIVVADVMTPDPVTIPLDSTIQDALLLVRDHRVGAFPVVDETGKLRGILSDSDLLRAFINVLGINEPGMLLGILVDEEMREVQKIVDVLITEGISFGSILVARHWKKGKRAVFPYLLSKNIATLKQRLTRLGFDLLDPADWQFRDL
jgi:acetoin utilization protein AcuB